jgi:hypothetical protein
LEVEFNFSKKENHNFLFLFNAEMGKHLPLKETAFKYTARKKDKKKRKKVRLG